MKWVYDKSIHSDRINHLSNFRRINLILRTKGVRYIYCMVYMEYENIKVQTAMYYMYNILLYLIIYLNLYFYVNDKILKQYHYIFNNGQI
ncbi:hypothetical protein ACJX0J_033420, partial [Zea mays]